MKRVIRKAIAIRLAPFLVSLIVSLGLTFARSIYVNRQAVFNVAADRGYITRMRIIYALGVNVNQPACQTRLCPTPLVWASSGGHPEAIEFLLERGAEVNKTDKLGRTALMMASYYGSDESVELLLARGADVSITDRYGNTALSLAKQRGQETTVELLRRAGAKETP